MDPFRRILDGRTSRLSRRWPAARRQLAATGLAALATIGLASSDVAHAQPAGVRTVTMRAAADETYRAQPNWEQNLRATVATVSTIYEQTFQIRFVVLDIVPWTAGALRSGSVGELIEKMAADVPPDPADIVVGFSHRCERLTYGGTELFGRVAMVTTGCYETTIFKTFAPPDVVLSHELAHIFGAFHPVRSADSVMVGGPADRFDDQALRVIRLMRDLDFSRGVMGVSAEKQQAWSAIYAEGHAPDEPNPLATAILRAGRVSLKKGRTAEGETALREAMQIDPRYAGPHALLGELYILRGQLEAAVDELRTAKALDFQQVKARTRLGFVYLELGRPEEALWEFRELVRLDPKLIPAHIGLGMALVRLGKIEEAIDAYGEAIRLDPKSAQAFDARGYAFSRKGAYIQSIQDYDQAILLQPADPELRSSRCFTRVLAGKAQEGLADCNEALRLKPQDSYALVVRGLVYLKLDQPDRALADYDAALRLDPRSAQALYGRAVAKRRAGDTEGAAADFAAASKISSKVAEEYTALGVRP